MHVRIAVDRLHEPEAVLDVGLQWAKRLGATVDLLFVAQEPPTPDVLEDHTRWMNRIPAAQRGKALVRQGRPSDEIVADLEGCDLLMVGTHGWRGFTHLVLGSVAERVVRTSTIPVLVLRSAPPDEQIRALVAVDATKAEAARTVALAVPWLTDLGARVDLLHVEQLADTTPLWMDPATMDIGVQTVVFQALAAHRERDKEALGRLLQQVPGPMRGLAHFTDGDPSRRVAEASEGYDLTVLATEGRSGIDRLWLGSVTEATLRHTPKTALVLRQPAA